MALSKEVVAWGLEVPEGPVVLGPGRVAFVEQMLGRVSLYDDGTVSVVAQGPGSPNSIVLGSDGELYAAQNGGAVGFWPPENLCTPGIQRIELDGSIEEVATSVAGVAFGAPNDLVFGPDGRLYVTDPGERYDRGNRAAVNRLFALGHDGGETLLEVAPVYINGLGFTTDGVLCWVESYDRHVCLLVDGSRQLLAQLPPLHVPDGLDVAEDGRLFITTVTSHGIDIVSRHGELLELLYLDDEALPTNCCFEGSTLWVTDFGTDHQRERGRGRLWRVETDAIGARVFRGSL